MPDLDPMSTALLSLGREAKDPRVKVRTAASVAGVAPDVADDFLNVTGGIESGNAHYDRNGRVKRSPIDPKDGQRAIGFSQIKPATARSVGVTNPYDEMQNIIAGVKYFSKGGNDPVRRRIAYFGGTKSRAVASYDRTGRIPSGQDQTGTTFKKYVGATMRGVTPNDVSQDPMQDAASGLAPEPPKANLTPPEEQQGQAPESTSGDPMAEALSSLSKAEPQRTSSRFGTSAPAIDMGRRPVQNPKASVKLGAGLEMASPDEIAASQKQSQSAVSPIEFKQGIAIPRKAGPTELVMRHFDEAPKGTPEEQLAQQRYRTPASTELGEAIRIPFSPHFNPTQDDVVKGYLNAMGPEYAKYGELYKHQTGRNILSLDEGSIDRDPSGTLFVKPTRAAVDVLNAYVQSGGDLEAAKHEATRIAQERRGAAGLAEQQAAPDIARLATERKGFGQQSAAERSIGAPTQRFAADIGKMAGGITSLGGLTPNQLSDFFNQRSEVLHLGASLPPLTPQGEEVQRGLPEKGATALADLGYTIFEIAALKRATGLSTAKVMMLESALKNSDKPLKERAPEVAQSGAMGRLLDTHMSRVMSGAMFGVPTAVESEQQVARGQISWDEALLNTGIQSGVGAGLAGGKEKDFRVPEVQAREALGIDRAQPVPDFNRVIAEREQAVRPPASPVDERSQRFYHRDWGEVIKAEDQTGARSGSTKVYEAENPDQFHYPRTADLSGAGNQRMVPVKGKQTAEPSGDPMSEALSSLKIQRAQEPDAGATQFRGMSDGAVADAATRSVPKGTSRQRRAEIATQQAAARAELERRQSEKPLTATAPPDTGLRAKPGDVPSFRDYVESRPGGGLRFNTLEPGTPEFNQLAREYTARYGTRAQAAPLITRSRVAPRSPVSTEAAPATPLISRPRATKTPAAPVASTPSVREEGEKPEAPRDSRLSRVAFREGEFKDVEGDFTFEQAAQMFFPDVVAAAKRATSAKEFNDRQLTDPEKAHRMGQVAFVAKALNAIGVEPYGSERWTLLRQVRETTAAQPKPTEQPEAVQGEAPELIGGIFPDEINAYIERGGTLNVPAIQRAFGVNHSSALEIQGHLEQQRAENAKPVREREKPIAETVDAGSLSPESPRTELLLAPASARTRTAKALENNTPLNPKAQPLVEALNDAGIPTEQSGDLYGKNVVYVDLPGGKYTEGKLTRGVDTYERALKNARLPEGWKVVRADAPASEAFETGKKEKPYSGPRSTAVRLIRKGGAVTADEAQAVASAVRTALARTEKAPVTRGGEIVETAPVKTPGQRVNVAGLKDAEVIDAQRLDGVDYELYKSGNQGVTRIFDADSGEVVGITKHPEFTSAAKSHSEAIRAAGGNPDAWRDSAPASAAKAVSKPEKAAREELPPVKTISVGRESKATTDRGSEIQTRYAIVELDDLITSHDSALRANPKFPQELQPRERDRAASADQISRISSQLRPDFLSESPKASEGAPITGPDGVVESGNGRVLGLRKAYEAGNPGSKAYRQFLLENAERLGLDRNAVGDAKSPVLVRIRTSDVDRAQFVKEANEQSIASMSPVEQARSDATKLTGKGGLLDLFNPSETGEINTAGNLPFVRAFMRDVVGPNEINRYQTASGQLSLEGISRIRNAIFARAFGDSPEGLIALEKLAESPDNNVRNLTTAMLRNAARFASLKEGIDQGTRYPLDLAPDIAAAMGKLSSLRDAGQPVGDYLRQGALYAEDLSPIQKRLLQVFDENKRGANIIDAILKNYVRGADAAGSPNQTGMFGTETPSKTDFLEAAIQEAIYGQGIQAGLLPTVDQGLQPKPASRGANQEANARTNAAEAASLTSERPDTFAPRLDNKGAPPETEGRPLKPFDSTIDRLKSQEENARLRLAERATKQQEIIDLRGKEAGSSPIPEDLYDYVVIGASKLARKSLNVAQFVDEMVREFGEAIRSKAREIFKLSQRMVADTEKEIRTERLSREIADRLFTEHVPQDQQREALRIAAMFRTSTDTQGKFLSGFKSRVGEMAKSYGAAGGELTNRLHLGDIARGHEMEAGNKYLSRIQDVYNKTKNDFERQRISSAVIKALENRESADRYLDTPEKKAVYQDTKDMLDEFRAKLKALGYTTRDDYFTHIREVDILDQIISDAKDPREASTEDRPTAASRFLQPRLDAKMEIKKDLPKVLFAYLKSVTKEIAYSDAVDYFYKDFTTDIPISLRKSNMDRAIKLVQNSLKPEQGRGTFYRAVGRLRSEQYRNFLAYNLKASAQNFTQVNFARMRWTKEASDLAGKMWRSRKTLTGPLADAIDLASTKETPLMRFLEQFKGEEPSGTRGGFAEAFNRYDPFQRSEKRNWQLSELGSIINSVVKRPEYKDLKAKMGAEGAINEMLKKQDVFDGAVREAATTAAETQVAANPAMRGEFYDAPLHRIIGMFTAFKTRQLQILGEALRSHEGINGARAQTILRRGLSGDAQPVEVLREVEAQRGAMEKMVKRASKFNEDLGIPRQSLDAMIQHLKTQEGDLNDIIKRIEPLSGGRARSAVIVAKYFAKVSAISVFFNLFWNSIYSAIAGPEKKDEDAEGRVSTALKYAFWDVLPSPFYGVDPSKFLVSPIAPNFERSAPYGHITRRGVARDVVSYGSSVIPFAGVIDRATNRWASGKVVDMVAPKKEKEQKIKF